MIVYTLKDAAEEDKDYFYHEGQEIITNIPRGEYY